jgi:hypothetical protein
LPPQFRRCKSRPTCVSNSIELEPEATKTPTIELFDIIDDEKTKEKHAANQFFSSLLGAFLVPRRLTICVGSLRVLLLME